MAAHKPSLTAAGLSVQVAVPRKMMSFRLDRFPEPLHNATLKFPEVAPLVLPLLLATLPQLELVVVATPPARIRPADWTFVVIVRVKWSDPGALENSFIGMADLWQRVQGGDLP